MPKETADQELGGLTALCKANAGIVLDECARCAVLLFGGNGYTRTGKGEIAESKLFSTCFYTDRELTRRYRDLSRSALGQDSWWKRGCSVGLGD